MTSVWQEKRVDDKTAISVEAKGGREGGREGAREGSKKLGKGV